ncbi:HK97 family phage prohead protease [Xanthomonas campestris]|uniref:HK97 family phage prohead protease n=1 Tax=Xanthomonas campestris TaxID=339 RepID=UPI000E1E2EF2|nr:HK97 family phage prohead protease [Xanthomonas campestris]
MKTEERAYSVLEVKSYDDDQRILTGWATTPEPDRYGDIVEPLGAKFAAELPLLWQHRHDSPVGIVKFGKPTKQGIPFSASVAKIETPGALKDMCDLAWQSVKEKLVRGVSIGFRPLEYSYMEGGGIRFTETEIYELSLVTIPANAAATIQTIKAMDTSGTRRSVSYGVPLIQRQPAPVERPAGGAVKLLH